MAMKSLSSRVRITALLSVALSVIAVAPSAYAQAGGTVVCWGGFDDSQCAVPAGLSGVRAVAAGGGHSLALKGDGTVVAWGNNDRGQTSVPADLRNVKAVAAGGMHSLALKIDGTVVAWGNNDQGQASVPTGLSHVKAVAAGGRHSLALKSDGTVVAWGDNSCGNVVCGQATVPTPLGYVVAVAAGNQYSLALESNGRVVFWGDPYGPTPPNLTNYPVALAPAPELVSLALWGDGTVHAWGSTMEYPGGNIPMSLCNDQEAHVTAIAAGAKHGLALRSDGTVVAWGDNTYHQTGVPAHLSGVTAIAAGDAHSLALCEASMNSAPIANDATVTTNEDTPTTVTLPATDADGDSLTFQIVTDPASGSVATGTDGSVTYTPNANWYGTDTFQYRAFDGSVFSGPAIVTISVSAVNDAPVALPDSASTTKGTKVVIDVLGNDTDVDGDALTLQSATAPSHGKVTLNRDGTLTYAPASGFQGTDEFTYTVADTRGASATATVTVTVVAR